jgi:aspartate racemase
VTCPGRESPARYGARVQTIGVLGGIGPQATMEFEQLVHRAAQELIPPNAMEGYPPLVVSYCRFPPFVVDETGAPAQPREADPRLLEVAARLGAVADFLVVTSNATHLFQPDIETASGREVLGVVELVVAEIGRRGWHRVGIVGFGDPVVYADPLRALGFPVETLPSELRDPLDRAIPRVMEGRADADDERAAREAIAVLRGRGVNGIVLGCTEIPPLLGDGRSDADLLDPLPLLAEAAVRRAAGIAS